MNRNRATIETPKVFRKRLACNPEPHDGLQVLCREGSNRSRGSDRIVREGFAEKFVSAAEVVQRYGAFVPAKVAIKPNSGRTAARNSGSPWTCTAPRLTMFALLPGAWLQIQLKEGGSEAGRLLGSGQVRGRAGDDHDQAFGERARRLKGTLETLDESKGTVATKVVIKAANVAAVIASVVPHTRPLLLISGARPSTRRRQPPNTDQGREPDPRTSGSLGGAVTKLHGWEHYWARACSSGGSGHRHHGWEPWPPSAQTPHHSVWEVSSFLRGTSRCAIGQTPLALFTWVASELS